MNFNKAKNKLTKLGVIVKYGGTAASLPQCPNTAFVAQQDPPRVPRSRRAGPSRSTRDPHVREPDTDAMTEAYVNEDFTPEERALLEPHVTTWRARFRADQPARGRERRPVRPLFPHDESLRRLFLDEFANDVRRRPHRQRHHGRGSARRRSTSGHRRVRRRLGRLARRRPPRLRAASQPPLRRRSNGDGSPPSLEQSTRYMRYHASRAVDGAPPSSPSSPAPSFEPRFETFLDTAFSTYGRMYDPVDPCFQERFPQQPDYTDFVYRQLSWRACDTSWPGSSRL